MRHYLTLGSTPCDEECAQVGDSDYYQKSLEECTRYLSLLNKIFGTPPGSPRYNFGIKSFNHDFGTYREVVISYDDELSDTVDFAFHVENNLPQHWE